MRITQRDEKLLLTLSSFGLLKTSQIHKVVFCKTSKSALLRRLNLLEKAHLIRRIRHFEEAIWSLTHRGARVIGEEKARKSLINHNTLNHDVLLSEIRFKLEKNNIGENWELEHSLKHKILAQSSFRSRENLIIPDDLLVVNKGQKEAVALELELYKKSLSRYKMIFRKYQEKKNLFCLWYIVRDKNLGEYLEKIWKKTTWRSGINFCYSLLDEFKGDLREAKIYQENKAYRVLEVFQNSLSETKSIPFQMINKSMKNC